MKTYKVKWNALIKGFFSDSTMQGVDLIEAEGMKQAWEAKEAEAKRTTRSGRVIFKVTDIEEVV